MGQDTYADAAQRLYAAQAAVAASTRGSDEWVNARMEQAAARDAYDVITAARATAYVSTIRNTH